MRSVLITALCLMMMPVSGASALAGASAVEGASGGGPVFTVQLYFPQPDGRAIPAPGVPVEVHEFAPAAPMMTGRGAPERIATKRVMSDASGLVRVPLKGRAGRNTVEAIATYQNASFRTGQIPSHQGTASIPLYPVVDASKGLLGGMVCRTEVSESYLLVDCALKLVTRGTNAVRLNSTGPKIPFVGLAVGPSGVMNSVITEKRYNHFNARVHSGNVVVKRSARGVFLDGVILPEAPASIQIRYPIPHLTEKTELAIRSEFPLWTFGFELNGPERYPPELQISEHVRRIVEVERGRVIHSFQMSEGLAAGKVLTMSLANMPIYNPLWRTIVVGGGFLFLSVFLALWFRFWRQEREEEDGV